MILLKNKFFNLIKFCLIISICFIFNNVQMYKIEIKKNNENINKNIDLIAKAQKEEELIANDLYTPIDNFNGYLTGYVANCPLCSGRLGCNGQNVLDGTLEYNDKDYGLVRIVASSGNLKCGSIVQFNLNTVSDKPIVAIVLDRGVLGTNLDLLVESEDFAIKNVGGRLISYSVLRNGYMR